MPKTETPQVRPRQVFKDNAPGMQGRTFRIVERLPNGAVCEILTDREGAETSMVGRRFVVLLNRLHTDGKRRRSGYSLVEDAPDAD